MTFIAIESFAVTTVLPVVATDLDGLQWYSVAYAATLTAALVGMIAGGSWADRAGVTIPLMGGGALFLLGIGLCAVAPDMTTFVVGRFLQGLGGGIDSVVIYVAIAKHIPGPLQANMFGLLTAAWLVPSMAGPLAAGLVAEVLHWRIVFAVVLVGSAIALAGLLWATWTPRSTGAGDSGPRLSTGPVFGRKGWAAVAAATCLMGLHLGGQQPYPRNTILLVVLVTALVLLSTQLLPPGTLRASPGVPALIGLRGLLGAAVVTTDVYLPLYLQKERDFSPGNAGLVIAIGALGWAVGAWVQGRTADSSTSAGRTLFRATSLVVCGPVGALAFISGAIPVAGAVAGCVLMGIGMGMAYPRISSGVVAGSQPGEHGANSSALQASESMATSAFLAGAGVVLTTVAGASGYDVVYAAAVVVAGAAVVLSRQAVRNG
ncbi:MFS transporter [Aeromicrobium sp. Sec7.5]|uniref:MFS transporter n=1 Tax=Aeromicrobium sp. Sec7.5 TaxID=3121276 RepID=UPI002FE45F60